MKVCINDKDIEGHMEVLMALLPTRNKEVLLEGKISDSPFTVVGCVLAVADIPPKLHIVMADTSKFESPVDDLVQIALGRGSSDKGIAYEVGEEVQKVTLLSA